MNAIGAETFPGQHRGTGAGIQFTCNRIAGIVVCSLQFICFIKLADNEKCLRALSLRYTLI